MRHFLTSLMAAAFVVGLSLGLGQANAAPLPTLNGLTSQASPVEKVGYYGNRGYRYGGYYPRYNYYRPYYRNYGYRNYGYRNYGYRNYGYRNYGSRRHYNYRRYW